MATFGDRAGQRRAEPSARLFDRFQVGVGWPRVETLAQHRGLRATRIEPHVQHVLFLVERRALAILALDSWRYEVSRRTPEPRVGAFGFEDSFRRFHHFVIQADVAANAALERRDRHAPRALARETPVRPHLGHVADTVARPRRNPSHGVDFLDHPPAQTVVIDTHEPLLGREENQRVLAAPAMRIAVRELEQMEQRAGGAQSSTIE